MGWLSTVADLRFDKGSKTRMRAHFLQAEPDQGAAGSQVVSAGCKRHCSREVNTRYCGMNVVGIDHCQLFLFDTLFSRWFQPCFSTYRRASAQYYVSHHPS